MYRVNEQRAEDDQSLQPQRPQQPADDELAFPDSEPGNAWSESITKRRAAELEGILQGWEAEKEHGQRKGPFHGIQLTGADAFWLAVRALAWPTGDMTWAQAQLRSAHDDMHVYFYPSLAGLHLEAASLHSAHLEGANLGFAHMEDALLDSAYLEGSTLIRAHLDGAFLSNAHLEGANLHEAHLEEAYLGKIHLAGAWLHSAHLEGANLLAAHLEGKRVPAEDLLRIRQSKLTFPDVLPPADMRLAFLDSGTEFKDIVLGTIEFGAVLLADVRWGGFNLAVVDWTRTTRGNLHLRKRIEAIELGDEYEARTAMDRHGKPKDDERRLQEYKDAVRANRQLATVLRNQGLNEDADRFAYKAQTLQREVLRRQGRHGSAFGSWILDRISGYGYKPLRSFITYLLMILGFALIYFILRDSVHPALTPLDAIIFSITSFHGRGFSPGESVTLHNPLTIFAAGEAIIGLLIEITFIATFTQRFFAR